MKILIHEEYEPHYEGGRIVGYYHHRDFIERPDVPAPAPQPAPGSGPGQAPGLTRGPAPAPRRPRPDDEPPPVPNTFARVVELQRARGILPPAVPGPTPAPGSRPGQSLMTAGASPPAPRPAPAWRPLPEDEDPPPAPDTFKRVVELQRASGRLA